MSTTVTIERSRLGPTTRRSQQVGRLRKLATVLMRALQSLDTMLEKRRSRRVLMELTEYQLKDIGLSRLDAVNEAQRPFWR